MDDIQYIEARMTQAEAQCDTLRSELSRWQEAFAMFQGTPQELAAAAVRDSAELKALKASAGEIEEQVISKIRSRRDVGRKKYGTTMERTDLTTRDWFTHAQEEAMDLAIYLQRISQELAAQAVKDAKLLKLACEDAAHDDTRIRELCKPFLTEFELNGDSYGVPGIIGVVETTVNKLKQQLAQAQAACAFWMASIP